MKKTSAEVIKDLLKNNKNLQLGDSVGLEYNRIPFNIPALDKLTGGGIPKKRFTLIYGPTNVGKSYLASQIVVNVQKEGGVAAWIDTELSWDPVWNKKCGIDTSKLPILQPTTGEEVFDTIRKLMVEGVDVIVLDSIAGLVPTNIMDNDFSHSPMAWQARFVNGALPKLLPNLKHGSALVAINQVRSSVGPTALDNMPGGLAQSFFAHFLMQVRRHGWIKEGTQNVGFDMEVRLRKTKVGGENWSSATVPFRVEGGIDIVESYIREAIKQGLIEQTGSWYTYKDTRLQGLNGVRGFFIENGELFKELQSELST